MCCLEHWSGWKHTKGARASAKDLMYRCQLWCNDITPDVVLLWTSIRNTLVITANQIIWKCGQINILGLRVKSEEKNLCSCKAKQQLGEPNEQKKKKYLVVIKLVALVTLRQFSELHTLLCRSILLTFIQGNNSNRDRNGVAENVYIYHK